MATNTDQIPAEQTEGQEGTPNGEEANQATPDGGQGTPPTDSGAQSPFSHASLRGRSPEDVERYVSLLENTVREQGTALNRSAAPAPQQQAQTADADISDDQYWQNPTGVLRRMIDDSLKPFREDLQQNRALTAMEQLRKELPDFQRYEPIIDSMLTQQGITDRSNPNLLKFTYYAIRGQEATMGGGQTPPPANNPPAQQNNMNWPQANQTPQNQGNQPPPAPPQHRPSNSPLPPQQGNAPRTRQLTESERRIAREMGQTDEQYLQWLEVPSDQVATSNVGRQQEGGR